MITQELVKELFKYRDGVLFWRVSKGTRAKDMRAGSLYSSGYRNIGINGKKYKEHRLIFLYHRGYLPPMLDHRDLDRQNNPIGNLREATSTQNHANMPKQKNNTSGYKGAFWNKTAKKYMAQIKVNGKHKYLGYFDSPRMAALKYNFAAEEAFGKFARFNQ